MKYGTQAEVDAFAEAGIDARIAARTAQVQTPHGDKREECRCKRPRYGNSCCLICYGSPRRMLP